MRWYLAALVLLALWPPTASSQGFKDSVRKLNVFRDAPEISVVVEHPPRLGLDVDSVAFASPEGDCAKELVDSLLSEFVNNGVGVVDRANIETLLAEHEFILTSGAVDREDALEIGKMSGADALVIVKTRRCVAEEVPMQQDVRRARDGSTTTTYTAETRGSLRGTVQVIDLTTAKLFSAHNVQQEATLSVTKQDARPAYPPRYEVVDLAINHATVEVKKLFFPWTLHRSFNFYDENQCNLKIAYRLMQAGDLQSGLEESERNVEICEHFRVKKPKLVAKSLYNLGVAQFLLERFHEASETLEESLRLDPNKITSATMAKVRELRAVAQDVRAAEDEGRMTPGGASKAKEERDLEIAKLKDLYEKELISEEMYEARMAQLVPPEERDLETQLVELKKLFEQGLISKEVYDQRVAKLLDSIE